MTFAMNLDGPRKTETDLQNQDPCIFGPISGQNVVLARAMSRNGGFKTGRNRGFWGVVDIGRDYFSLAYSAFASLRIGISGSASFQSAKKSL